MRRSTSSPWSERYTFFAKGDTIEFGFVGSFTDAVGRRALGLGPCVVDIFDRDAELIDAELILVPFRPDALNGYRGRVLNDPGRRL
jgi:hypothetical protein